MPRKQFVLTIIVIAAVLVAIALLLVSLDLKKNPHPVETMKPLHGPCLEKDEYADYPFWPETHVPKETPVVVSVRSKTTNEARMNFSIPDVEPRIGEPPEIRPCAVYAMRFFNYDPKKIFQSDGYKVELWKYDYSVASASVLLMGEVRPNLDKAYYNYTFRVGPAEEYLAVIRGYLGSSDYALVLLSLKAGIDTTVSFSEIAGELTGSSGSLDLDAWTHDGHYFWGRIFDGADVLAFFRVNPILERANVSMFQKTLRVA
ncbi:MAG: hypothetical protein A3A80_02850 [Candidatus Terrybacteria bacterium RIFCSPLOWO2_01_FULL_44_24]|uniref:Uncharacterized protein n=1 Tax=Candidatus Terrybacteria bacterium RIFCSPHIGHO2_01_FULL_43_35 TaxID=1802361 RepID=A0A1G2PG76_9BACT|nr:MAG: hypothetical protein A2828_02640 [Candidatus Terrybacteria bacterium RIFCSPHIGHO2_01_FULL_43_35]OHA50242.1 MAG: hypothetical protein A3B75_00360 [Candidatus Terrybacteria bacterium RIFCSPHIGHO2_02_FULL_43_14]OHA51007.1 MAG: hypothetical protein A3A80_02850 [Candidatus Terrybacteria bacterium RIFCSPLOWO2_01_FULL_44_24]